MHETNSIPTLAAVNLVRGEKGYLPCPNEAPSEIRVYCMMAPRINHKKTSLSRR
jgi:hypothetical protein